ncbi:unnamed protein product [Echinostoma caproni]|uniref:Phosphatidylinositol-3-phosphatase SAC1 n=1 Tax=Echinostoma caproni TaxID=27848 RepID=A0A183BFG1_9TREM|nr:unnamed protein product [Echinostoma caproni]
MNIGCKLTWFLVRLFRYISPEVYYIVPLGGKEVVLIDRISQELKIDRELNVIPPSLQPIPIYGIWGTIRLISGEFNHFSFFVVLKFTVHFIPLESLTSHFRKFRYLLFTLIMLETVLNIEGFYYSTSFDLTHTQQRLADTSPEFKTKSPFERCDPRFTWNHFLLSSWLSSWNKFDYCIPVIQGFVGIIDNPQGGPSTDKHPTIYALISRRSVNRVGTRFNSRGVDQMGNASNTVETEQILDMNGSRFSFVQVIVTNTIFKCLPGTDGFFLLHSLQPGAPLYMVLSV